MRPRERYEMPEAPKACVRCGTPYGLARQPVAFRAGWRRFRVDLPFCQACLKRYETARRVSAVAGAVAVLSAAGGAWLSAATRDYGPMAVGGLLGVAALAGGVAYLRSSRPRAVRTESGALAVDVPGAGRFEL